MRSAQSCPTPRGGLRAALMGALLALAACTVTLTAPYDQGVVDGLTVFQEDASVLFSELSDKAPDTPFAAYEDRYRRLNGKLDALLTRAIANSEGLDGSGERVSTVVNDLLADATEASPADYEGMSLSAAQIHDLRLLIRNTRDQHQALETRSSGFWTLRGRNVARIVSEALTLERFKKD